MSLSVLSTSHEVEEIDETQTRPTNKTKDKRLSTQVVFTAAIAKIFSISLSCECLSSVHSSVCSVEGH